MIRTVVRRSAAVLTLATLFGTALALAGGAASADTPIPGGGWETKPQVNDLQAILLFVGIPILVLLVVSAMILGPALARGEAILPKKGDEEPEGQWLGGPRKSAGELADPDSEGSAAGGAGGTW
ncbi:MAG: hypothetical protein FWE71_01340 [Nocardioidaceae bacterium]|nr:hypothetical protein [Nocardioidaceae bacterium]MCL2613349.1 hypothetical protein [Nocardioidaceae bacterium]